MSLSLPSNTKQKESSHRKYTHHKDAAKSYLHTLSYIQIHCYQKHPTVVCFKTLKGIATSVFLKTVWPALTQKKKTKHTQENVSTVLKTQQVTIHSFKILNLFKFSPHSKHDLSLGTVTPLVTAYKQTNCGQCSHSDLFQTLKLVKFHLKHNIL